MFIKMCVLVALVEFACVLSARQIEISQEAEFSHTKAPIAYNKRADIHFSKREYAIALENYQKVIHYIQNNGLSDPSNLPQAMCGSMFCYDLLQQDSFC